MSRWSSGQDVALSRRIQGFDSPTGYHQKTAEFQRFWPFFIAYVPSKFHRLCPVFPPFPTYEREKMWEKVLNKKSRPSDFLLIRRLISVINALANTEIIYEVLKTAIHF
jgi:hypothetical protein